MSLLNLNVEDVPDLEVLAPQEYELKIEKAEIKSYENDKGSGQFLSLMFSVIGEETAKPVFHSLFFPNDTDNQQQIDGKKRGFKAFFQAFNLPLSGETEVEELRGATGWAYLRVNPEKDGYEEKNYVSKFQSGN